MEILLLVQHGDLKIFGLMKDIVLELLQQVVRDGNLQNGLLMVNQQLICLVLSQEGLVIMQQNLI